MLSAAGLGAVGTIKNKFSVIHLGLLGLAASTLLCGILPSDMVLFLALRGLLRRHGRQREPLRHPLHGLHAGVRSPRGAGTRLLPAGQHDVAGHAAGASDRGPVAERFGVPLWFFLSGIVLFAVTGISALLTLRKPAHG